MNSKNSLQNPFLETGMIVRGSAPAKLILSGEHSVLYGAPALAVALDCRLTVDMQVLDNSGLQLRCPVLGLDCLYTPEAVSEIAAVSTARYQDFLKGGMPIAAVLEQPHHLFICALDAWLKWYGYTLAQGLTCRVVSAIPMGYGLGSSAAGIVALWRALEQLFADYAAPQVFFERARSIEHLQHGRSSGIDVAICQTEAPCLYRQGVLSPVVLPTLAHAFLVNTGYPCVSTGVCVEVVRPFFVNTPLAEQFTIVTLDMVQALESGDEKRILKVIRANHRLLCHIGVVPLPVQSFVQAVEEAGGAAKLCGAGASEGEAGGMAWVMGDIERLVPIFNHFGYSYEMLCLAHHVGEI